MKKHLLLFLFIITVGKLKPQSSSVFDANYFNMGNKTPLIELGKGINITDVYKPTKHCFITTNATKLKRTQNGQKTTIAYYYTKNDDQYNTLKTQGTSGQVSYLNLFSIGGSDLSSTLSKSSKSVERVVIIAKVDFGLFTLSADPILKPEAKALITKAKYDDFIDLYGTHYISGVKKESSLVITLTKKSNSKQTKHTNSTSFNEEFCPPSFGSLKLELTDSDEIEKLINSDEFNVNVEINGPGLKADDIQTGINKILSGADSQSKLEGITALINGAFKNISDPAQANPTQYYYSPFTLYNLKVIQWNEKKQNELVKINQKVLTLYSTKVKLEKLTSPSGPEFIANKFDNDIAEFSEKEKYRNDYINAYTSILPSIINYQQEVDTSIKHLENIYRKCSDIYCNLDSTCGSPGYYAEQVDALTYKIKNTLSNMAKIKNNALIAATKEINKPECEKENVAYLTVINVSTNAYDFYNGDTYVAKLPGGSTTKFKFPLGVYTLKASQTAGYLLYPTINYRKVNFQKICTEQIIKVGFED